MSRPSDSKAPRWAKALILAWLPADYAEAVLGDLEQELAERLAAGEGATRAKLWFWTQVIHMDVWRLRGEARREHATGGGEGMMRDTMMLELRQALRVFVRSPGFVAAAVMTLSVGIGGTTAIFSLVNGLLLRPVAGVEAPDRLAAVRTGESGGSFGVSSYMDYLDFAERSRSFESLAAFKPRQVDASSGDAPEPIQALMVTSSYFDVVGVPTFVGRYFAPSTDTGAGEHPEVVLTHGLWRRWFAADTDVVGRAMILNGRSYTVVGVTPPGFRGTELVEVPELFVPMTMQPHLMPGNGNLLDNRGWGGVSMVGRLADGVTQSAAAAEIEAIGAQIVEENPRTAGRRAYRVLGFREASLPGSARGDIVQMSVLLLAVVGALWLVVCLNVANLFFARSLKRREELAVRIALGAGRARITSGLILEFMSIALVAGVLGMFLAQSVASAVATLPLPVLFDVSLDWRTLGFAGLLALSSGFLCALVPAFAMSGTAPRVAISAARGDGRGTRRLASRVMIVSQVTLSVVLLFATGLFTRTFANLTSANPGFDSAGLLTGEFNPQLQGYEAPQVAAFYAQLTEAASAIPGVESVTLADALPSAGNFGRDTWFIEGSTDPEQASSFMFSTVSSNFFETLQIPVAEGRSFSTDDTPNQPPALVVNRAGASLIESRTGRGAVGSRLSFSGPRGPFLEVVGVVGDSRTGRVLEADPLIYGVHEQVLALGFGGSRMVVMLKTSLDPATLSGSLRRVAAQVDPNVSAANVTTMDDFLGNLLATDRLIVTVLGACSALALLLVAVGVYGLLAYLVTQRTREFGIRVALGARAASLKSIVVREALTLAVVGLVLGAAGALFVTRFATSVLVGVSPSDPVSLSLGIATVILVTLGAAYVPAQRAMRADPVVAMRVE